MSKRVVVTGLGLLTPYGRGVDKCWKELLAGKSAIRSTKSLGPVFGSLASHVAAWVTDTGLHEFLEKVWNRTAIVIGRRRRLEHCQNTYNFP